MTSTDDAKTTGVDGYFQMKFKNECKELLNVYKLKEYRRYGNVFKTRHCGKWKSECSLAEFVWNYLKTPRYATRLMDFMDSITIDEQVVKKWLTNVNASIDPENTYLNIDDALEYLENNPDTPHVHVLNPGLYSTKESLIVIDDSFGDLFHGLVIDSDDIDKINNIRTTIMTDSSEVTYVLTKDEIGDNLFVIHDDESNDDESNDNLTSEDDYGLLYYLPLFKHPIPLVHMDNNDVTMYVKVVYEQEASEAENYVQIVPLYTLMNSELHKWLLDRSLILTLRDGDSIRVGPDNVKIIQ